MERVYQQLQATKQKDLGLVRSTPMPDQNDPHALYMPIVFESEEKARAREHDIRPQEALREVRTAIAEIYEGPPAFIDLTVAAEYTG